MASFRARTRDIKFYDVPLGGVKEELRFRCDLDLVWEASAHLAPLLLSGFHAEM